jgi:8-oxo-dGTP pyrophosphatase MutT (NUDIX family)
MYIKIYFNNKPLFLCDEIDKELDPYIHHDDAVFIDELNSHTVKAMIHEMNQTRIHAGVFYHPDLDELKKVFFKKFTLVQAAGGLVENEKKEILLIFRRGMWDLPKGKLDEGESLEECAVREVEEETGLQNVKLIASLALTYHTYYEGARYILKESHWYKMLVSGQQKLIPQSAEQITDIKWVKKNELSNYLEKCYPSVADILQSYM